MINGYVDEGRFQFSGAAHRSGPAGSYTTDGKVALIRQSDC